MCNSQGAVFFMVTSVFKLFRKIASVVEKAANFQNDQMLRGRLFQTTGVKAASAFNNQRLQRTQWFQRSNHSNTQQLQPWRSLLTSSSSGCQSLRICAQERGQIMAFSLTSFIGVGFAGAPFLCALDLLWCWSVRVKYPCFMGSHQCHKGVFVAHEQGHLSLPLANKCSYSPPFL